MVLSVAVSVCTLLQNFILSTYRVVGVTIISEIDISINISANLRRVIGSDYIFIPPKWGGIGCDGRKAASTSLGFGS